MMLALIDGDLIVYRVGFTCDSREGKELDPEWVAKARATEMVEGILADTAATEYQLWLSDSRENNFRTHLWAGYKANRTKPKPVHYNYIKELLITEWGARIAYGMEADDALGIGQSSYNRDDPEFGADLYDVCIASIDKDLLQIVGRHWNFVKKEWKDVTEDGGRRSFYTSILVGDTTDNIRGCRGIGPVKAAQALVNCSTDEEYIKAIIEVYKEKEKEKSTEEILDHILLAARLLKIRTTQEEPLWDFPLSKQTMETLSPSTPQKPGETTPSTVHI